MVAHHFANGKRFVFIEVVLESLIPLVGRSTNGNTDKGDEGKKYEDYSLHLSNSWVIQLQI